MEKIKIRVINYSEEYWHEKEVPEIGDCFPLENKAKVTWISLDGLPDVKILQEIGNYFGIHSLILEDILDTSQRPKIEIFDNYVFIVLKMISIGNSGYEIKIDQISIILGINFVISFQETSEDIFYNVRQRIRNDKSRMRRTRADYLSYTLIDTLVDNYFAVLENLDEKIEFLEDAVVAAPSPETLQAIHTLKREMIFLRKSIWPLRDVIKSLEREESALVEDSTKPYIRDVYDHTVHIIETIEIFREMLSGLLEIYLSSISQHMNEVMKLLTIISTVFIPLTFITGIYGMNFEYMPELRCRFGYFAILLVMVFLGFGMIIYFRKKRWL
jgi:magnesium transporter